MKTQLDPQSIEFLALRDARIALDAKLQELASRALADAARDANNRAMKALDEGNAMVAARFRGEARGYERALDVVRVSFDVQEAASGEKARVQSGAGLADGGDAVPDAGVGRKGLGRRNHRGRADGDDRGGVSSLPRHRPYPRP